MPRPVRDPDGRACHEGSGSPAGRRAPAPISERVKPPESAFPAAMAVVISERGYVAETGDSFEGDQAIRIDRDRGILRRGDRVPQGRSGSRLLAGPLRRRELPG